MEHVKVKSIEPKKATCNVASWKITTYIVDKDGNVIPDKTINASQSFGSSVKNGTGYVKKSTKNSITVNVPSAAQVGSVIKVDAYTNGGVVAYAYMIDKTTIVRVDEPATGLSIGQTASIGKVMVELGKDENKQIINKVASLKNDQFGNAGTNGSTTAYITEPVTYAVDKNSAKFIKVDQNGNVTGIQKTGKKTATVTVKTVSGKSAKVKIKVN